MLTDFAIVLKPGNASKSTVSKHASKSTVRGERLLGRYSSPCSVALGGSVFRVGEQGDDLERFVSAVPSCSVHVLTLETLQLQSRCTIVPLYHCTIGTH